MPSLSAKDRVSLCQFTFTDGRRCRTPRTGKNPHFCFDHAQKEARALAEESLSKDLAYFFSGDYLSACDLSAALGRLIPAVIRGDVKPRTARTVAYLAQTLLQTIHLAKHEYINTFGTDGWRKSIRDSVNYNHDYLFPPAATPEPPPDQAPHVVAGLPTGGVQAPQPVGPPANCHSARSEESAFSCSPAQPTQPALSPHTSLPPTSAEFVQHVLAGLQASGGQAPQPQPAPASSPTSAPAPLSPPPQPAPVAHSFTSEALPPHVRRRLHRTTTPTHPSPPPLLTQPSPLDATLTRHVDSKPLT